jgi:gas vesicle protein GvpN
MRAYRYLQSGFSVHLRGPAGTGKTTLALHLADLLARPMMLLYGDDDFKTSDLIGNQTGYTRKKVVDNFIHSVVKVEDELRHNWVDSRLTLACREGFTLIYDEFNRSRPEVNNVLLSALEEKLLVLPPNSSRNEYIRVNPQFRAILTSNPEEYCGVHATQDALLDRLVTINIPEPDELTQQEIIIQKTGIDRESAVIIVQVVRAFRKRIEAEKSSGLRACLILAKVCHEHEILAMPENPDFRDICQDILLSRSNLAYDTSTQLLWEVFNEMIAEHAMQQDAQHFAPQMRILKAEHPVGAGATQRGEASLIEDEAVLRQWLAEEPTDLLPGESLPTVPSVLAEVPAQVESASTVALPQSEEQRVADSLMAELDQLSALMTDNLAVAPALESALSSDTQEVGA